MHTKFTRVVVMLCALCGVSGCIVVTVVSATATVVGGAIDVVDAVTPDIFDDDEEDNDEKQQDEEDK